MRDVVVATYAAFRRARFKKRGLQNVNFMAVFELCQYLEERSRKPFPVKKKEVYLQ